MFLDLLIWVIVLECKLIKNMTDLAIRITTFVLTIFINLNYFCDIKMLTKNIWQIKYIVLIENELLNKSKVIQHKPVCIQRQ